MGSLYRNGKSYVFSYYKNGDQKYHYISITDKLSDTRRKQLKKQLESRFETKSLNKKFSQKLDTIRNEYIDLKTKEADEKSSPYIKGIK